MAAMADDNLVIRRLVPDDVDIITDTMASIGWNKPRALYEKYVKEQETGARVVHVAFLDGRFAGYLTVWWNSDYPPFREQGIPEVVDFGVVPELRRQRIGWRLMDAAEETIATRSGVAGIGVGLGPDYGPAQRLYVMRGYVPDGLEVWYDDHRAAYGETVVVNDSLIIYLTKQLKPQP